MTGPSDEADEEAPAEAAPGVLEQLIAPVLDGARRSGGQLRDALGAMVEAATHPEETLRKAGFMLAGARMLAGELLRTPDPPSPLKGEFGLQKRVAWSAPVALADVKAIGVPLGAKINDVLVAGMTGALRDDRCLRGGEGRGSIRGVGAHKQRGAHDLDFAFDPDTAL